MRGVHQSPKSLGRRAKFPAMATLAFATVLAPMTAHAPAAIAREPGDGVKVGNPSIFRKLYPAAKLEYTAAQQYDSLTKQAEAKHALLPAGHPMTERVRRIGNELLPFATKFNERAKDWDWKINVINSKTVNAFCMPGGKIAVFSGIINELQLTDDELAMVMGHEIAHALHEHARERAAKGMLTNLGVIAVGILAGGSAGELARVSGGLMGLKFSRSDESEADLIGMELAARAGYDPRSGVTLWEKMSAKAKGAPPQWMSTHPSGQTRIADIKKHLDEAMPIYERAKANRPR